MRKSLLLIAMAVTLAALAACGSDPEIGVADTRIPAEGSTTTAIATSVSVPPASVSPTAATSPAHPAASAEPEPVAPPANLAPDFTLPNANGSPITLSELSAEKPVVVVFYRAFW